MTANKKLIRKLQKNELSEHLIYKAIANQTKNPYDKKLLEEIANQEYSHYKIWQSISAEEIRPNPFYIFFYSFLSRTFGYTFVLKRLENGEVHAQENYEKIGREYPIANKIYKEEQVHEKYIIQMLNEKKIQYVGSMVLGLNDALVELTGTLAGLSFALQNTKLIALSGIITGISATLSMMSSEYLSKKSSGSSKNAITASFYTGIMYFFTVVLLVLPYLILPNSKYILALIIMLVVDIILILTFTYYISIVKDYSFKTKFKEMLFITLGVTVVAYLIGMFAKIVLGIEA